MNASTQAVSIGATSKIASISVIFRSEFPLAIVDLSPWIMDEQTQQKYDPNSLDFAFSFPDWHSHLNCGCILLQIYFTNNLSERSNDFRGIEAFGHGHRKQYWNFSSITDWQFYGDSLPTDACQQKLKCVFNQIHSLFGCPASLSS